MRIRWPAHLALRNQVHDLAGDGLRREGQIKTVEHQLDRIKIRLDLTDAEIGDA